MVKRGRPIKDRTGDIVGRLTALSFVGIAASGRARWSYSCTCGNEVILQNARTGSCGCLVRENCSTLATRTGGNIKHGHSPATGPSSEYMAFHSAFARCTRPTNIGYAEYGGRGIRFLFNSFEEFIKHIGLKPSPDFELDRIDTNSHYMVGNVRWATRSEQMKNRRPWSEWKHAAAA